MELTNISTGKLNELRHFVGLDDVKIFDEGSSDIYSALEDEASDELKESPEMWVGKLKSEGYEYAIMGDGDLTSDGEYVIGRVVEDYAVENSVTLFPELGEEAEQQAISESESSDKILSFKDLKEFTLEFQRLYVNGEVYGVYYDEESDLVCETKSGEIIKNILR